MKELVVCFIRITEFFSGHEDSSNFKVFVSKKTLQGHIQYYTYRTGHVISRVFILFALFIKFTLCWRLNLIKRTWR